ncbi:uncharacterized protein LOC126838764 isoform X2 [Adelges cooleyi]|nr:uncharacterized protein LOC126838764 isoform X2 [Adelges cooleyi]
MDKRSYENMLTAESYIVPYDTPLDFNSQLRLLQLANASPLIDDPNNNDNKAIEYDNATLVDHEEIQYNNNAIATYDSTSDDMLNSLDQFLNDTDNHNHVSIIPSFGVDIEKKNVNKVNKGLNVVDCSPSYDSMNISIQDRCAYMQSASAGKKIFTRPRKRKMTSHQTTRNYINAKKQYIGKPVVVKKDPKSFKFVKTESLSSSLSSSSLSSSSNEEEGKSTKKVFSSLKPNKDVSNNTKHSTPSSRDKKINVMFQSRNGNTRINSDESSTIDGDVSNNEIEFSFHTLCDNPKRKCTSNYAVISKVIVKPATSFSEAPRKTVLPKRIKKQLDTFQPPVHNVKGKSIPIPIIQFTSQKDYNFEVIDDSRYNKRYLYPENLKLIPLRGLSSMPEGLRLAPHKFGDMLKHMSSEISDCKFIPKMINNASTDLLCYYLLYGVVPEEMTDCAVYFLKFRLNEYNLNVKNIREKRDAKYANSNKPYETVPLVEGELEALTFNYWRLSTQDLCDWDDNAKRDRAKSLLAHGWKLLSNKYLKDSIASYANFNINDCISAECMLFIKQHFTEIIHDVNNKEQASKNIQNDKVIASLNNSSNVNKSAFFIWNIFMKECGVHHYMCHHTMLKIHKSLRDIHNIMENRYKQTRCQLTRYEAMERANCLLSRNEVFKLFYENHWIKNESQVSEDLRCLVNELIIWQCRSLAFHLFSNGITWYVETIHGKLIDGYAQTKNLITLKPIVGLICTPSVITAISKLVTSSLINLMGITLIGSEIPKYTLSEDAQQRFMVCLQHVISNAIAPAVYTDNCQNLYCPQQWSTMFSNAIELFLESHRDKLDSETINATMTLCDDKSEIVQGESGKLVIKRNDGTYESFESDCDSEEDEEDTTDDSESQDEIYDDDKLLKMEFPDYEVLNSSITVSKKSSITKKALEQSISQDSYYQFSGESCPRIKCVTCFGPTTEKLIAFAGVKIACCVSCVCAMNEIHNAKPSKYNIVQGVQLSQELARSMQPLLLERIRQQIKAPIYFKAIGIKRAILKETHSDMRKVSYNRLAKLPKVTTKHKPMNACGKGGKQKRNTSEDEDDLTEL